MATGTLYKPTRVSDFEATKLQFNPMGIKGTINLNTNTNVDLYFADDNMLTGMWIYANNATIGDYMKMQIIDTDNIFGAGAGALIKQFGDKIYLPPSTEQHFDIAYPAKIYAGLSLRIVYTSTSLLTIPSFIVNYKLHKVLV